MLKKIKNTKYVSIVIPLRNEEGNISRLVSEIIRKLKNKYKFEIILIDDGSNDNTFMVMSKIKTTNKGIAIKIIRHVKNYGQSASLLTGIKLAKGTIICTLDGDGQNDPNDMPKMLDSSLQINKQDLIIGNRVKRNDSLNKKIASRLAFMIRKILLKDNTPDTGCGLKIFYKRTFLDLPYFDHMHRFMPFLFKMYGGNVFSIKVNHRKRIEGKSNYSNFQRFRVGISDVFGVMWLLARSPFPIIIKNKLNDR